MAKIKLTAFLADIRGKVNGTVFSKNRSGAYARTKVTPVNAQTSFQTIARARLASFAAAFRALTQAQIAAWNNAVQNFKGTDIFGDIKTPSGINLYCKLNANLDKVGSASISSPPVPINAAPLTGLAVAAAAGAGTVSISANEATAGANIRLYVESTAMQSPGKNFVKSEFREIVASATNEALPFAVGANQVAKFGAMTAGQKIFVRVRSVDISTGIESLPQVVSAIVAA